MQCLRLLLLDIYCSNASAPSLRIASGPLRGTVALSPAAFVSSVFFWPDSVFLAAVVSTRSLQVYRMLVTESISLVLFLIFAGRSHTFLYLPGSACAAFHHPIPSVPRLARLFYRGISLIMLYPKELRIFCTVLRSTDSQEDFL